MKHYPLLASALLLLAPASAIAQVQVPPRVMILLGRIYDMILNPIIILLFAVAFLYFMYGVVRMVWGGESGEVRENGRRAMFWGIIGMFIMFSVFTILRIVINTIGADANQALGNV